MHLFPRWQPASRLRMFLLIVREKARFHIGAAAMEQSLSVWEAVCLRMNVTLAFELEGRVDAQSVIQAFQAVAAEYVYLRSVLSFRSPDIKDWYFVERPDLDVQLEFHDKESVNWQEHIQRMANTARDPTRSLTWLELYSQGSRHQLFATVSHAGMDGTGLFHMFDRLFEHLGQLSQGESVKKYSQREFVELKTRIPAEAASIPQPSWPAEFMPSLKIETEEPHDGKPPRVEAVFAELSADVTAQLVSRAKLHKASVQGIISAASMVAIADAQAASYPLPQTLLVQAPTNLRKQLTPPVDMDNSFCGSSFLRWAQQMAGHDTVWDVASKATEHCRKENENKGGLSFWWNVMYGTYQALYTITSSSVGVNPIKGRYGHIKIDKANMMLATYDQVDPKTPVVMTHAQTFDGRLCTTFGFSLPAVGEARAKKFAALQNKIIAILAEDAGEGLTVQQAMAM